ncbi:MAG: DNA polymerase III subunit delta' [Betaproteobacteria bacterium]
MHWEALPPWLDTAATGMLAQAERWPHALLVTGTQGIGKRLLALHLAQALLCETPAADRRACGRCAACNWVERGTHPDLRVIVPVTYDDEGNATPADVISVDAIRDLIAFALLSSHRGGAKVAVIAPAEALNAAAANALLKTLEEPPPRTSLILVSSQPGRLPATITSRCRRLAVPVPDHAQAVGWLAAQRLAHPERALALAGGAPLRAVALGAEAGERTRDWLLDLLSRPERMSPVAAGARVEATPKDERKGMLADVVYGLLTWTADLAAVVSGGAPRFHTERGETLAELSRRVARVPLFRYHRALLRQRALLSHPLQPRLVAEAMLFEYRMLFGKR